MKLDEPTPRDGARATRHLAAEHAVARALAGASTFGEAIEPILEALGRGLDWAYAAYWVADEAGPVVRRAHVWTAGAAGDAFAAAPQQTFGRGAGLPGRVWASGAPVWIRDHQAEPELPRSPAASAAGLRSSVGFPVLVDGAVVGVVELLHPQVQEPDAEIQAMMAAIGAQLGQFIAHLRSRERLIEKRRRLELALEAGRLGPWEWDLRTGKVTWSAAVEAMHGVPTGSFGGTFEDYQHDLHPDDRERVLATIRRAVEERRDHHVEYRILRPDRAIRWLEARGRFVLDDDGAPIRLVGVCTDVTEQKEALIALQLSEAFHSATLMSVGDAVMATDATGRITLMNGVAEALTGWQFRDALGLPLDEVFQIVNETTRQPVESPVTRVLRERAIVGLANHTLLLRPDGTELAIDDSAAPIRGADGAIAGVVMVFRDVTEKRQDEERRRFIAEATRTLSSSLDYKATLASVARLAVPRVVDWCAVDVVGPGAVIERVVVAHADPAKVTLVEELSRRYPPDPETGVVAAAIRTGESALIPEITDEMLAAGAHDPEHLRLIRALGLSSYMVVPLRVGDRVLGAISFVNAHRRRQLDHHDLQRAEELGHAAAIAIDHARLYRQADQARIAAEAAARRIAGLQAVTAALSEASTPGQVAEVIARQAVASLGASAGGVVELDRDGETLAIVETAGYARDAVATFSRFPLSAPVPAAEAVRTRAAIFGDRDVLERGYPEAAAYASSERGVWAALPLVAEGRALGAMVLSFASSRQLSDDERGFIVTLSQLCAQALQRAQLFAAEQRARAQAETAMRGREDLLAIVSHDLRNPLGSILNSAVLVERLDPTGEVGRKARKYADIISRSAHRMNRLIADLLDLASLERGALRIEPQPHDAGTIIHDSVEMFAPMAAEKPIHLAAVRPAAPLTIRADRERILQVLSNLIGNALKFTPEGGQILVSVERDDAVARFSVTDTGVGIAEAQQPHIFDRYWKGAEASRTGVGLGLSIAKGLIEAHGGTIAVRSKRGDGTTFTFAVPLEP